MSSEYELLQQENELLHSQIDSLKKERNHLSQELETMKEAISTANERNVRMEKELESTLSENIQLYEMVNSTQREKSSEAMLIGLQSENKQLKEVIVRLHSTYSEEKKHLMSQLDEMKSNLHTFQNEERSECSQLCATYLMEISSLRAQLEASQEAANKVFTDASELSSLRRENDESRILLQLDKDLISEYDALIQESDSQLSEKEQLLLRVTRMLQSVQEEKQRQEEELRHCKKRLQLYENTSEFDASSVNTLQVGSFTWFHVATTAIADQLRVEEDGNGATVECECVAPD